jgi:F-type H+-transporting ATPase subunit gamma
MTRRREVERHRASLVEIGEIMGSMKTLAYMEKRKLARFLPAQTAVVRSIEEAAADFLAFHPGTLPRAADEPPVFLLIGSERGFCGDFNRPLLDALAAATAGSANAAPRLLLVGQKLQALLMDDGRVAGCIAGANVAEEVPDVLQQLVAELVRLQASLGRLSLVAVYHGPESVVVDKLLPPFRRLLEVEPPGGHAPLLQLSAQDFLLALTEQYVFAALHHMLYTSLLEENRRRLAHLEGATRHLDEQCGELARRSNVLRQEEIIEEIEVILLNASTLANDPGGSRPQNF